MPAASLLDAVNESAALRELCVSLMLRVRERCYGSKSASDVWTFARSLPQCCRASMPKGDDCRAFELPVLDRLLPHSIERFLLATLK